MGSDHIPFTNQDLKLLHRTGWLWWSLGMLIHMRFLEVDRLRSRYGTRISLRRAMAACSSHASPARVSGIVSWSTVQRPAAAWARTALSASAFCSGVSALLVYPIMLCSLLRMVAESKRAVGPEAEPKLT